MEDTDNGEESRKQSLGVDPDELTARLLALGGTEDKTVTETPTPPVTTEEEEGVLIHESEVTEKVSEEEEFEGAEETLQDETEELPEEKEVIIINTIDSSGDEEPDDDTDLYESEGSYIIYGNVKIFLSDGQLLNDPVIREKRRKISEIPKNDEFKLAVKSVWWKADVGCNKCPSKFNCTCDMSIVDIVKNLGTCFDVIVIPDNNCKTCLQILDIIRERDVIFCELKLEDIDKNKLEELRLYLTSDDVTSGILHHWSHSQEDQPKQVQILGQIVDLPPSVYYDLIVIGTSSVAAGIVEETEKLGMSVCLVDVQTGLKSSSWIKDEGYSNYMDNLKMIFQEAVEVQKSLKHSRFTGIANTDQVFFSWDAFRLNAKKVMKTLAWKHRVTLTRKGTMILAGSAVIINPNTIKVKQRLGDIATIRGTNIVIAHHRKLYYQHFTGMHRYCLPVERLLSSPNIDVSKTLVYGPATSAMEYSEIFNCLGLEVTVMMFTDFPSTFDKDMVEILISYMSVKGVQFIQNTELCHVGLVPRGANGCSAIPNITERLVVIGRNLKTWEYSLYFFDNVIVLPNEQNWTPLSGLKEVGVKFSKYDPEEILVDDNFRTAVKNIFVLTGREGSWQTSKTFYEVTGKNFVQYVKGLSERVLKPDLKFGLLSTRPEYCFYGLSELEARKAYSDDVRVYHTAYNPWNVFSLAFLKPPSYIKLICRERTSTPAERKVEDIIGLHVLGRRSAGNIVRGFSFALSEGLTKEELDSLVGVQYSSAEAIIDMNLLKGENDHPLLAESASFSVI